MIVEVCSLGLDAGNPRGFEIVDQSDTGRGAGGQGAEPDKFLGDGRRLMAANRQFVKAWKVEAGVRLFLGRLGLAPAEITDHFGPVRQPLPGPQADHAGFRHRIPRCPVHRARLLLHDPEPAAAHAPVEVVMKGGDIGMRGFGPAGALVFGKWKSLDEANGAGIPRGDIEMFA